MTGPGSTSNPPQIIYKYTDLNGAQQILSNRTLRFTRPSEMNDPFDVRIDEWVGMEHKELFEKIGPLVFAWIMSSAERASKHLRMDLSTASSTVQAFQNSSDAEKTEMMNEAGTISEGDFAREFQCARDSMEKTRDIFSAAFEHYGIFCATSTFSNLLMWAHYAGGHSGAVLGFRPDRTKDSMLGMMRPVIYRDQRVHGIESPVDYVKGLEVSGVENARMIADRLLHTKSVEWSYEEEWRLSITDVVKTGEAASFFRFYPSELAEVYIGYRMSAEYRSEIIRLARTVSPDVQIFAAKLAKRKYALEFETITE